MAVKKFLAKVKKYGSMPGAPHLFRKMENPEMMLVVRIKRMPLAYFINLKLKIGKIKMYHISSLPRCYFSNDKIVLF